MILVKRVSAHVLCRRDPVAFHRRRGVVFGAHVALLDASPQTFGSEPYLVDIGDHVTISQGVRFITHDGGLRVIRDEHPGAYYYAPIRVGARAFIGAHAILLPGATVGECTVVGAGAVVAGDLPAGYVCAGVPARPLKTVEQYAYSRRADWVDTSHLSEADKRTLLEMRVLGRRLTAAASHGTAHLPIDAFPASR